MIYVNCFQTSINSDRYQRFLFAVKLQHCTSSLICHFHCSAIWRWWRSSSDYSGGRRRSWRIGDWREVRYTFSEPQPTPSAGGPRLLRLSGN